MAALFTLFVAEVGPPHPSRVGLYGRCTDAAQTQVARHQVAEKGTKGCPLSNPFTPDRPWRSPGRPQDNLADAGDETPGVARQFAQQTTASALKGRRARVFGKSSARVEIGGKWLVSERKSKKGPPTARRSALKGWGAGQMVGVAKSYIFWTQMFEGLETRELASRSYC